jgi:hypothetical protein
MNWSREACLRTARRDPPLLQNVMRSCELGRDFRQEGEQVHSRDAHEFGERGMAALDEGRQADAPPATICPCERADHLQRHLARRPRRLT